MIEHKSGFLTDGGIMDDKFYMKEALALAEKGRGFTAPNPMVGAVVVKNKKIIGKGYHEKNGSAHAEVNAINDAGSDCRGASIYVTLEPCNHTGKTPPCTEKILKAGIKRVVMAMDDPNPVAAGGAEYLRQNGIEVISGICKEEAEKLNESFIKYTITKKPFVILKYASTLDGRIATKTGDSKWISGPESRKFVHEIRHYVDAIMVGINTIKADDPSLTTRLENVEAKDPRRIILDTRLSFPEDAKMLRLNSNSDTILVSGNLDTNNKTIAEKRKRLEKMGVTILEVPLKDKRIDLAILITKLGEIGITSLLIEGGSQVIASALNTGIVDKVFAFYGPKMLGGDDGIPVCRGKGPALMKDSIKLSNISVRLSGEDVMVEAYPDHTNKGVNK